MSVEKLNSNKEEKRYNIYDTKTEKNDRLIKRAWPL